MFEFREEALPPDGRSADSDAAAVAEAARQFAKARPGKWCLVDVRPVGPGEKASKVGGRIKGRLVRPGYECAVRKAGGTSRVYLRYVGE